MFVCERGVCVSCVCELCVGVFGSRGCGGVYVCVWVCICVCVNVLVMCVR